MPSVLYMPIRRNDAVGDLQRLDQRHAKPIFGFKQIASGEYREIEKMGTRCDADDTDAGSVRAGYPRNMGAVNVQTRGVPVINNLSDDYWVLFQQWFWPPRGGPGFK